MYCRERTSTRETVQTKMWNKIVIFVFFAQKVFSWLRKITFEPLMLHGLFINLLATFLDMGTFQVVLLSMEGLRALRFKQKYLNLCSDDERRSYWFGTTSGWVIKEVIFIFGWTNPLREPHKRYKFYFHSVKQYGGSGDLEQCSICGQSDTTTNREIPRNCVNVELQRRTICTGNNENNVSFTFPFSQKKNFYVCPTFFFLQCCWES